MSQEPNSPFTLRVYAMLECPTRNTFCPDLAPTFSPSPLLTLRSVKLFADGARTYIPSSYFPFRVSWELQRLPPLPRLSRQSKPSSVTVATNTYI